MPKLRLVPIVLGLIAVLAAPAPTLGLEARWPAEEALAWQLLQCTRSGGWVTEAGECGADERSRVPRRAALRLSKRISDDLARPYARRLARAGHLSHSLGGSIQERFAAIGMGDGRCGENLGYAGGDEPMAGVLRVHRLFQEEWSSNGWHFRNMLDGRFTKVGIGVWVRDGRTYLVHGFHS